MAYELPPLPYPTNALEPYIDEQTMRIHHDGHHKAYVEKLNAAIEKHPELGKKSVQELISNLNAVPEEIRTAVRNQGGGHANHSFFWPLLKKDVAQSAAPQLMQAINKRFGGFEKFKEQFSTAANGQFGSGWAWLVVHNGDLEIVATPNQDSPLSSGRSPIIGIDVWEHAYYLKYQNKRAEYVKSFFSVINWERAEKNYLEARK
jgi:Fe-Mn family superoxide dismutase